MKVLISIFFVAGSLALIGMLDNSLSNRTPKQNQQDVDRLSSDNDARHPLLTERVPKRPPFNDEGPGSGGGVIPGPRPPQRS
jgi:hypothetical protein